MKRVFSALCCLGLCSVTSFAQKMTDQDFVDFAAQTDMVEANLGQLAGSVAASQGVKDYGQMLATDHTQDYGQLTSAAQQASLTAPTAIDSQHNKAMIDPFQKLHGAAFDHKYIQEMIAGHTKAIAIYKTALPVLQKHLDQAKALAKGK
jgi:putative membrane protein